VRIPGDNSNNNNNSVTIKFSLPRKDGGTGFTDVINMLIH
jgi:hypothetical protein